MPKPLYLRPILGALSLYSCPMVMAMGADPSSSTGSSSTGNASPKEASVIPYDEMPPPRWVLQSQLRSQSREQLSRSPEGRRFLLKTIADMPSPILRRNSRDNTPFRPDRLLHEP